MIAIVTPKFRVGDKVIHMSNRDLIMVISKLVHEKARTNKSAFGTSIFLETNHTYFQGMFLCEWVNSGGKHIEMFNQDVLELAE
jgi:uncharacterized protein YodC (DUF2158 family)